MTTHSMIKWYVYLLLCLGLTACQAQTQKKQVVTKAKVKKKRKSVSRGAVQVVAELDICPGNVAVSKEGRIFMSVHPLRADSIQLVEILEGNEYRVFPNSSYQSNPSNKGKDRLDAPLGVLFDNKDRLWVVDAGLNIGQTRVFAFDIDTGEQLYRFDLPTDIAPKTSFAQDIAVDEVNGWVYLADFGDLGIIAIDIEAGTFRKFTDEVTMASEDIDAIVDKKVLNFLGKPARVGINPITLSSDRETIFYGAMIGTKWYSVSAEALRKNIVDDSVRSTIQTVGPKSISDGAATSNSGKHYITNIQTGGIDILYPSGDLSTLVIDKKIKWPDNVRFGQGGWLYVAVNQLHRAPAFTGKEEAAKLPYYILRVQTGDR